MRVFIFLFLSSTPFLLFSQEFEAEKYIASQIGRVSDSVLVQWTLDSMQLQLEREEELNLHLYAFQLKKTKDESLVVFHFIGEGCGAYCNPFYRSLIAIKKENEQSTVIEQDLFEMQIDSIVVLEANRFYLAFGKSSGRPRGIEGVWGEKVVLLELNDGNIKEKWQFSSLTSNLVELEDPKCELYFDAIEQRICFTYDGYNDLEDFKVFRHSGCWQHQSGTVELVEDHFDYYPPY